MKFLPHDPDEREAAVRAMSLAEIDRFCGLLAAVATEEDPALIVQDLLDDAVSIDEVQGAAMDAMAILYAEALARRVAA